MKVVIANDHAAVNKAKEVLMFLDRKKIAYTYLGTATEDSVDYPDMAEKCVIEYRKGDYDFGILLCGTGIGISIAANKMKGVRCALPEDKYAARMAKEHNNANFIAFGGRIEYRDTISDMLSEFMNAEFQGGRHQKRVDKIMALEGK